MTLYTSFRSEILKTKKSSVWLLTVLGAAIAPVGLLISFNSADGIQKLQGQPWAKYFADGRMYSSGIFLPFFIILLCTICAQIEYRNNAWKQVMSSPQSFGTIFFSKFLVIQFFILCFIILHNALILVSGAVLYIIEPKTGFLNHAPDWGYLLPQIVKSYLLVLAMSTIQFGIGIRFKNFILPIGVGFVFWVVTMIMAEHYAGGMEYFPYAYSFVGSMADFEKFVPQALWGSVAYAVIFLGLFFALFTLDKEKG
ncbi:hypothetical protein EWM62_05570 [Mucilaginibacter terrigena]|uniref:ABC transporter permease n=1 Tax=Mucilaginibacter terrigena TaxID=2492395 RepID=A0A4Q5LPS0_9SPHI|nr:ABC transporter permease [Mucilaginibacter terrigena]RYU91411.1 hypothetical protein EWM62_05570 [Mucilaginibacter terrigena]